LEADSLEFIDKEIFTDITAGARREADLLVKCRFQGRETFFLIHLEHQSKREKDFARRMFFYFARLTEKFALDFLLRDNPAASALMAKMGIETEDRVTAKKECLRMIARLKLDPARAQLLSGFVDSYIRLLEAERKKLETEMQKLPSKEKEEVMEIMTSWKEEGIEIGVQKGSTKILLRQLNKRLGKIDGTIESMVSNLSSEKLEELSDSLFDFKDIKDLRLWLNQTLRHN